MRIGIASLIAALTLSIAAYAMPPHERVIEMINRARSKSPSL